MASSSNLFLANAALTIPFGIMGLVAPSFTFGQFGLLHLDLATQVLIRGYASACLGYGLAVLLLRKSPSAERSLLVASATFNLAEALLQGHAVLADAGFNNMIWTTLLSHSLVGLWSIRLLLGWKSTTEATKDK